MNPRTGPASLVFCLVIVLSLVPATTTPEAVLAAGTHGHGKASIPVRCKTHNSPAGTITYSDWEFPDTLNAAQSGLLVTVRVTDAMFDSLLAYDNHARLFGQELAAIPSVKNGSIKDGGKTIVTHLKQGTRWSNGSEITSTDVKFSWQMAMHPDSGPACAGTCDAISSVDTPDRYTNVFHFKQPYAAALAYAVGGFSLYPHVWSGAWKDNVKAATDKVWQDPKFSYEGPSYPTNGPYQVAPGGFVKDDRIVLRPMKYYDDMTCGAYIRYLIFSFYSSKTGLIAAAAAGQTNQTSNYTAADLPELQRHKTFKLYTGPQFTFEHLELNVDNTYKGHPNPLSYAKVRQALALALDKIGLIRGALGVSESTARQIVGWTPLVNTPNFVQPFADKSLTGQYDPLTGKYDSNPGKGKALADAKKLLSQTPFKSGFSVDFYTTSGNPVRQAQEAVIAASWSHIGVRVSPNYVPGSKLFGSYDHGGITHTGQFQVGMWALTGAPDPDQLKQNMTSPYIDRQKPAGHHSDVFANDSGIRDGVIDRAYSVAAHSLDDTVRARNYGAMQVDLNRQAYWITLYFRIAIATADSKFSGFALNPTTAENWNIYNWKALSS